MTDRLLVAVGGRLSRRGFLVGGAVTTTTIDGVEFRVHTFTAGGTFGLPADCSLQVEALVVAGGGGGGGAQGCGRGGGSAVGGAGGSGIVIVRYPITPMAP